MDEIHISKIIELYDNPFLFFINLYKHTFTFQGVNNKKELIAVKFFHDMEFYRTRILPKMRLLDILRATCCSCLLELNIKTKDEFIEYVLGQTNGYFIVDNN